MAPPDLKDPVQRAAYHRELRGVALRLRRTGIGVSLAGALLVLLHRKGMPGRRRTGSSPSSTSIEEAS